MPENKLVKICELCGFDHEPNMVCPETKKCPSCGTVMLLHDRRRYCKDECKNSRKEENGKAVLAYLDYFINKYGQSNS